MSGPEFAFEVRPRVLAAYAESLRAGAADLAAAGEAVAAVRVEREWFGRLPQSGFLADRYTTHLNGTLAQVEDLSAWFAAAGIALAESAERYSAADRVVAGAAEGVAAEDTAAEDSAAGLSVGIEIPERATGTAEADENGGARR